MAGTTVTPRPIVVVGVDTRPGSRAALQYAMDEADMQGLPLRLVHVAAADPGGDAARRGSPLLPEDSAGASISLAIRSGSAIGVLVDETSTPGAQLVLGADHAATEGSSSGCVATAVLARAEGPVTVVPAGWSSQDVATRVVVVSLAGRSDGAEATLAEEFARVRGLRLERRELAHESGPGVDRSILAEVVEQITRTDIVFLERDRADEPHPRLRAWMDRIVRDAPCPVVLVPPSEGSDR